MTRCRNFPPAVAALLVSAVGLALTVACGLPNTDVREVVSSPTSPPATAQPTYSLLRASPERGPVGTQFTIAGEGLPANRDVDLVWMTADGGYATKADQETVEFYERTSTPRRVVLSRLATDANGRLEASLTAPEDYGDVHDLYAEVDGQQVAKGGFRIEHQIKVSPQDGAVGDEITIHATGLTLKPYTSTLGVLYDNHFAGFISATTTGGTAEGKIRAAGPVGKHTIEVYGASQATPFLNPRQGASGWQEFWAEFNVTKDAGAPAPALQWPDPSRLVLDPGAVRTTASGTTSAAGVSAAFEPPSGAILSNTVLTARGLKPNTPLDLVWMSVVGNRVRGGWNMMEKPMGHATVGEDGTLSANFQVPDDLGGWHVLRLNDGAKTLVEVPYFVEHSLVGVSPEHVKAGETVSVQVKGIGWTELDNGVAVTYDNSYLGYACGFNSGGDITLYLVATGGPGTHLIDLYPMLYQGHGKPPWSYQMPQLTFAQDAPGLALGYRLPTYRLAITID